MSAEGGFRQRSVFGGAYSSNADIDSGIASSCRFRTWKQDLLGTGIAAETEEFAGQQRKRVDQLATWDRRFIAHFCTLYHARLAKQAISPPRARLLVPVPTELGKPLEAGQPCASQLSFFFSRSPSGCNVICTQEKIGFRNEMFDGQEV